MHKAVVPYALVCVALMIPSGISVAQTPEPPPPTPVIVTATPLPQVIVVTATPSALPEPETFWGENGKTIVGALVGLIFGGVLVWLLRPAFEKLGNTLAESLSRLGSGWGFKKRYLTHLIEEYRGLNIRGLKTKAPVTVELEQVYVSLHAQVPDTTLDRQELPALDIGGALAQHQRLAILGGPGSGKTTLLAYLTLTYARGQSPERLGLKKKRLPILVPLRQLKEVLSGEGGVGTLPAYLNEYYTELGMHLRADFFERSLRSGHCLVLLDGLDEVADEAERRRMSEWVDLLVTIYPDNRYIVTSRPPGYESAPLENGFTVLRIRDFTGAEIRQFASNWCLAVELAARGEDNPTIRRWARETAQDLVAAIEANDAIRVLAVNPLLLSIIALVHRYRATLPKRRVDLYAECVDVLLGHWDEAKGLVGRLSPGEKRAVLQPLALAMHRANRRDVPRRELETLIGALLPKVGGESADAADFLDEVRERSGLLVELGLDRYAFSHQTFQEYLCARELVEDETGRGVLLEKAGDEWWQEVTLLYVGMAEATPIIQALLPTDDEEAGTQLLLAGRCLAEAVRVEEDTRAQVMRQLEDDFATCTGERFVRTGQVLADIAGEDSVDFFLRLAHDDPGRRSVALGALGQMGRQPNQALRERVLERLMAHFQGEELGQEAGVVLSQVWGVQTIAELRRRQLPSVLLEQALDLMMVRVPESEFLYGDRKKKVTLPEFWIDKTPVTNSDYKQFLDANPQHPAPFFEESWAKPYNWDRQSRSFPPGKATHPVVLVSWHDAAAYAEWAGKRLPTEEEWEKAARGTDGREYPWGDWEEGRCNSEEAAVGGTTPVGRYSPQGDSPYGCVDMAGNVWEWTQDCWNGSYQGAPTNGSAWLSGECGQRVVRGGSWINKPDDVRSADRDGNYAGGRYILLGFRVSRTLP